MATIRLCRAARTVRTALCVLACVAVLAPAPHLRAQDVPTKIPTEGRAREILKLLLDGKDAEFVAAGTDELRAALTPEAAARIREQLVTQHGKFRGMNEPVMLRHGKYEIFDYPVRFERASVTLRITLDGDQKLAGFHIQDVAADEAQPPDDDLAKLIPYVKLDSFKREKLKLATAGLKLPARLTVPNGPGKFPAVVLVHGSGPHDADETIGPNKPFQDLAWGLSSQGIVVLRYEKRTLHNGAKMDPRKITLEEETIDDALAAVELLRKREDVDPERIFVLGHSLGGMAAPFIAKRDGKLAGIIILGGNARPILDIIDEQLNYIFGLDSKVDDEEKKALDALHASAAAIRAGKVNEKTPAILGVPAEYWALLNALDQTGAAAKLDCRILVVQGGRDYQVTKTDFEKWQAVLKDRKNASFKLYDKLNHLMMTGAGKATPAEYQQAGHVDEAVIHDLAAWIKSSAPAGTK